MKNDFAQFGITNLDTVRKDKPEGKVSKIARVKPTTSRPSGSTMVNYMAARVEKLRELYDKYTPERTYLWVMPPGETDGRKALRVEQLVGEDISPFDLPDFEEQMPKIEDYIEDE